MKEKKDTQENERAKESVWKDEGTGSPTLGNEIYLATLAELDDGISLDDRPTY